MNVRSRRRSRRRSVSRRNAGGRGWSKKHTLLLLGILGGAGALAGGAYMSKRFYDKGYLRSWKIWQKPAGSIDDDQTSSDESKTPKLIGIGVKNASKAGSKDDKQTSSGESKTPQLLDAGVKNASNTGMVYTFGDGTVIVVYNHPNEQSERYTNMKDDKGQPLTVKVKVNLKGNYYHENFEVTKLDICKKINMVHSGSKDDIIGFETQTSGETAAPYNKFASAIFGKEKGTYTGADDNGANIKYTFFSGKFGTIKCDKK